jgi:hypothetical protein
VKIEVVAFCTIFLVASSTTKKPIVALSKWKTYFLKTLFGNIVVHAKMHLCSKYVNYAFNMVIWFESHEYV